MTARLAYRFDGPDNAPVVVLAGSLGTTAAIWDEQVPVLAKHYRLLRFDHRGHGNSEAPPGPYEIDEMGRDVLALLDDHGISRVSFCGLSLGGMVGIWLAAVAPERIERLALLCTSAQLGTPGGWDERIASLRSGGIESIADGIVARWFTDEFAARRPKEVRRWRKVLTDTSLEGYAGCCAAIRDFDLRDRLATITAPTLVLAGLQDLATPIEHQATLAALIPGAQLTVLDEAAHLAAVEQGPAVASALLDHLDDNVNRRHERGTTVRRAVLGDAHVDAAAAATTPFTEDFQRYLTGAAWADVWGRDGIDRRMRSAITLTALLAVNRMEEFALHVSAARRNGLSHEEIGEIVLNAAVYLGVPAANDGFRTAARVLAEES